MPLFFLVNRAKRTREARPSTFSKAPQKRDTIQREVRREKTDRRGEPGYEMKDLPKAIKLMFKS